MNIEEMQEEENFEHEVLDRLKCLDPRDFDYNAVDGSYVDAVLKARDVILTAYEKEKEKSKKCEYYKMVADELYKSSVSKDKIKPIQIIDLDGKIHNVYKIKEE